MPGIPAEQAEVAALLRRVTGAEPVETHISAVFVGPTDAWKLKKAVALGFLDFSTLAERERLIRRELELNRPAAPGIYRDAVPVTRGPDGALALGGDGPAVEWLLRMAPIPPGDFLDAIAARGPLDGVLLDAVADAVLAMHQAAPVIQGWDSPAAMARVLEGNRNACLAAGLDQAAVADLARAMADRIAALSPLLAARAAEGRVRRCHGDLHLGNLCLWEGRPTLFDALEFDERLASIDTGYDLAFLLMDLDRRAGRAAANRVMNRVIARGGDDGLLGPLPLWLALRAMVRAHVEARRGRDGAAWLDAAAAYLRPAPPRLLAIGGLPGTGKTRLARALAPSLGLAPGALLLRSDEIRKRRAGVPPEQRLPPDAYAPEESRAVHAEIFAAARRALAAGQAVVLDAVFLDPANRAEAEACAGGARFDGLWLEAPLPLLAERVAARKGDASDATVEVLQRAAAADPGTLSWHRLDAADAPEAAASRLLAIGGETRA
jgi:aminoglycoside phosphotransferase family enzyme/predicted kinase